VPGSNPSGCTNSNSFMVLSLYSFDFIFDAVEAGGGNNVDVCDSIISLINGCTCHCVCIEKREVASDISTVCGFNFHPQLQN